MPPARRASAVFATILSVALLIGAVGPAPARAQPSTDNRASSDPNDVRVTLVSQSAFVRTDEDLVLRLRVEGARPRDELRYTVWQAVERDELRAVRDAHDERTFDAEGLIRLYGTTVSEPYEDLVDPNTGIVTITVPPRATNTAGVYPITITVKRDRTPSDPLLTTTLVRLGEADPTSRPLDLAMVIPLRADLAHHLDGTVGIDPDERQRLVDLLDLAGRHPTMTFTYQPSPETLDALSQGDADDRALLERIGSAMRTGTRLGSAYVDIDEEALRAAGLDSVVTTEHDAGLRTLATLVGEIDTSIAQLDPTDTPGTLSLRRSLGARWFLADDRWLEPLDPDLFPATLLQSFVLEDSAGTMTRAVAADGTLAGLADLLDDPDRETDRSRALQQVVADLVAGHGDDPTDARGSVVVLPDDWDPRVARAEELLTTLGSLPQLRFVDLSGMLDRVTTASPLGRGRIQTEQSGALERSLRPEPVADLSAYAQNWRQALRHLRGLESISAVATRQPVALDALLWSSADDRLSEDDRLDRLRSVEELINARLNPGGQPAFVGPGRQRVTMTSREATIPIQIENRLGVDATVRIEMRSEKLSFPTGTQVTTQALTPGPNTVEVEVAAKVSGDSILEVTLLPPDPDSGLGPLSSGTFTVRATALSGVGLVLSVLAIAVLCVWWARHVRRTRRARAASSDDPQEGEADESLSPTATATALTQTET